MKNPAECAKRLTSLLRSLPKVDNSVLLEEQPDAIETIVTSFLMWECTTPKAETAYRNLMGRVVDFNDLRVCMAQEMVDAIGVRYPRGAERCERLRALLRDIYRREHAMTLDGVAAQGKREVRQYLETLEGMVPYVAARVSLLCFDAHAIPVDEQLRTYLVAVGAAEDSVSLPELTSWMERHIKASDGLKAHLAFQRWVDRGGKPPRARARSAPKTRKTTTRKKTATKKRKTASRRS